MSTQAGRDQFLREVFPAELEEIKRRRATVGLDATRLEGPAPGHDDLVGVAISGGGIRSATFSVGVLHALARHGVLKFADYLSTVSGGGYTAALISSVLNDPTRSWTDVQRDLGADEPPVLRHLRNSSNYLSPGGLLNKMRLPTLLVRGVLLTLFLFLPFIMAAVFLTELVYEKGHLVALPPRLGIAATMAMFVLVVIASPFLKRFLRSRFRWRQRNATELFQAALLLITILLIALVPFTMMVHAAIEYSWFSVPIQGPDAEHPGETRIEMFTGLRAMLKQPLHLFEPKHFWKWLIGLGVLGLVMLGGAASANVAKVRGKLALFAVGLMGPAVILAIYLLLCVIQIDSPFLDRGLVADLNAAAGKDGAGPAALRVKEAFARKGLALVNASVSRVDDGDWLIKTDPSPAVVNEIKKVVAKRWPGTAIAPLGLEPISYRVTNTGNRLLVQAEPRQAGLELWDGRRDFVFVGAFVALLLFNGFFLDVNITSLHDFYRDRLSKAYLVQLRDGVVFHNDGQKLSALNGEGTIAPYHLINVALNVQASHDPDLRGRKADFLFMSKRFVGGDRTGYCPTEVIERVDPRVTLGTAMAVSAAAASPNMGQTTVRSLVFIMTLLNIRLGYWLPNPARAARMPWYRRLLVRGPGPIYLLMEAVSRVHERGSYVNVSDGGHLENLAIYELLRRQCGLIIAIDSEADPGMRFTGLIELIRLARVDLGIEIEIDLSPIRTGPDGLSAAHWVLGTIEYGDGARGRLLYIKSSLTGDENEYIREYRAIHAGFPHEPTSDQFFHEKQFEAYRALGEHVGNGVVASKEALAALPMTVNVEQRALFDTTFRDFSWLEFSQLLEIGQWRDVAVGGTIAEEGRPMEELVLITAGAAVTEAGGRAIAPLRAGQFVGEMSFVSSASASATVRVTEPLRCVVWRQDVLQGLLDRQPPLCIGLGRLVGVDMSRKLRQPAPEA